jgi:plastocyanin
MGQVRKWAQLALGAAALLVGVTACGGSKHAAQTFSVTVDGHNKAANESFIAFFPNVVRVHPGDSVTFDQVGIGEPHTVTLGTLVDPPVAGFEKLTPQQLRNGEPPKALKEADAKLPFLLPQGPGDATQSAANPCYLDSGVPGKALCPKKAQPDFTGKQSFYNSGWLDRNQTWTVHLSKSTAPGTYHFMCLLHREGMSGKIVVVPSGTTVPGPKAQAAAGENQLAATEAKLQSAVVALRKGQAPIPGITIPGSNPVLAGSGSPSVDEAEIDEFGPKVVHIPVGGSVTWYLLGVHTITFNATKANDDIRKVASDGTIHLNMPAGAPAGGPGEGHAAKPKGKSPINFEVVTTASWNGDGFHSSGVFANSSPPQLIEGYKLTFTRKGTYKYICTVHDDMKGTVVVG